MTRTRWLAALAAAALLGGTARAQCCVGSCPAACTPPAAEPNRAPYYYELTQYLYPPHNAPVLAPNSNPAVWAHLFEVIARNHDQAVRHAHCESGTCAKHRHATRDRRMAFELLKLYRLFYREGQYKAAEIVADRAVRLDPENVAAEAALCMARKAKEACADAEDCEAGTGAACKGCCKGCKDCAKECGKGSCAGCKGSCACNSGCACSKSACACSQACACCKAACACAAAKCACQKAACPCSAAKCNCAKTSCACGAKCECCKSSCACGDGCACKKSARPKSPPRPRVALPPMMCPACPFCAQMQAAFPHPLPAMMPPPPPGMPIPPGLTPPPMHPVTLPQMPNPGTGHYIMLPDGSVQVGPAAPHAAPQTEVLPMPRMVNPMAHGMVTSLPTETKRGPIRVTVSEKQVCIDCPCLEARCNTVTSLADGRALLEGDVTVTFRGEDRPAKIKARRMIVDLETGAYEVNPARGVEPVRHEECEPTSKDSSSLEEFFRSGCWVNPTRAPGAMGNVFQQMNSPR